jgi:hypothetical protein
MRCALGLYTADGTRLAFASSEPHVKRVDFYARLPGPGTYYLGVSGSKEGSVGTFRYQLTNLGVDDVADSPGEATPIEPGQTFQSELQGGGDVDAYAFTARAGLDYRVRCTAPSSARLAPLSFLMPGMSEPALLPFLSSGATSPISRARQDGTASILVRTPIPNAPADAPIPYSCGVELIPDDAPDELTGPARALPVDVVVTGAFERQADSDVFAATLPARHHLSVVMDNCSWDCLVEVYEPSGARQVSAPAYLPRLMVLWTSRTAGEYRVRATGHHPRPSDDPRLRAALRHLQRQPVDPGLPLRLERWHSPLSAARARPGPHGPASRY